MAKHIIQGKVRTHDHKIFTVQKVAASEQDILLHFGRKVNYEVVKLSVRDLPSKDAHGKKITWINNFGVKELLDTFTEIAPTPGSRPTDQRLVESGEKNFTRASVSSPLSSLS